MFDTFWIESKQRRFKQKGPGLASCTFGEAFQTEPPGQADRASSTPLPTPHHPSTGTPNPMARQLSNCIIPIPELRKISSDEADVSHQSGRFLFSFSTSASCYQSLLQSASFSCLPTPPLIPHPPASLWINSKVADTKVVRLDK